MKNKKLNTFIAFGCMVAGISLSSCEDWLTIYPNSQIVEENFWEDKNDLLAVRYAAYKNMVSSSSMQRYLYWGEMRADNYIANPDKSNTSVTHLLQADLSSTDDYTQWDIFYNTINMCNKVLEHGEDIKAKDASFTDQEWLPIQAEMTALRALNYFYLVRAFGDVPYVTQSIDDDEQVVSHPATSQLDILTSCIDQMEAVKDYGVNNFGRVSDNKGFITKNAIYTILADMYLWRGSILEGMGDAAYIDDYTACCERSQTVINEVRRQKNENTLGGSSSGSSGSVIGGTNDTEYPLLQYTLPASSGSTSSMNATPYDLIFGQGNSVESIFELQCDLDEGNSNSLIETFYYGTEARLLASDRLKYPASSLDAESAVFYTTDLRKRETTDTEETGGTRYFIRKYACISVTHKNYENNNATASNDNEKLEAVLRSTLGDAHWIIYRVSEVMLMKAEALARLGSEENIAEAFKLVDAVYQRSNPYPYAKKTASGMLNEGSYKTKDAMEKLVLRERQREFVAEGKRWFDLVRFALRRSTIDQQTPDEFKTLACTGTDSEKLKKKLVSMKSLFMPINETELKTNTLLQQNPVWDKNQSISKN